jgi:hypothetical protein
MAEPVCVGPETVTAVTTLAATVQPDGTDSDVDSLAVPFKLTEDADGSPSSSLPGSTGLFAAVPVLVTATSTERHSIQLLGDDSCRATDRTWEQLRSGRPSRLVPSHPR